MNIHVPFRKHVLHLKTMNSILPFVFSLILVITSSCMQDSPKSPVCYDYLSYLPPEYHNDESGAWPLIIFLHGASLRGNDPEKIKKYGIPKLIEEGKDFNFIVISPQCPLYKDWSTDNWFPCTYREILHNYRVDTSRIYLTGLSLGGEGTWYISQQHPEIFTAIAPVCGQSSKIKSIRKNIDKIGSLPVWIFHGAGDKVHPIQESDIMYELLKDVNPVVKYTRYPDLGHGATHDTAYKNPALYEWFLSFKKY